MEDVEKNFYRYGALKREIDECKKNIREMTAEKYACMDTLLKGPKLNGEKQKIWLHSDPVYQVVQKMVDVYDARISKETEYMGTLYFEFDELQRWINRGNLSKEEKEYVRLRYVERETVTAIAELIGYSERQMLRLKKKLMKAMDRTYDA